MCSAPVLAAPDFAVPFKLEVDASALGADAVLLQESVDGIDHPICFFSRKFDKHQLKYSTIEKEALALLLALQYFEVYVGSSSVPVTVYTDHNPLCVCTCVNKCVLLLNNILYILGRVTTDPGRRPPEDHS